MESRLALSLVGKIAGLSKTPWPAGKVKRLRDRPWWELKQGDFRVLFAFEHPRVIILRIIDRKELEKAIERIHPRDVIDWLRNPKS